MASAAGAPSVPNLWCLWVLLFFMFVFFFQATESLSADGRSLLQFKFNVVDRRGRLSSWLETADNPCTGWFGVECNNSTRVVALELPSLGLSGTISSSLCDLDQLVRLDLSGNTLSGQIPQKISLLSKLIYLQLGDNALTGPIPSLPTTLLFLTLQNNFLVGNISALESIKLIQLDLHGNGLSGSLPASIEWTSWVENLDLSGNQFEGTLPLTFGNMGELFYMNMSSNSFIGEIPQGPWTTPTVVDLSRNRLRGSIPSELLRGRTYLNLSGNSLTGSITPTGLTSGGMQFLDLSNNQLSGPFPEFIAASSGTVQFLYLENNQLTGNLQSIFSSNFSNLRELKLSGNRLTVGTLPRLHTKSFPRLQVLELAQSNVEGDMRAEVFNRDLLPFLRVLDLSGNGLQGSIPDSLMYMPSLQELRLARNDLTGDIQSPPNSSWTSLVILDLSHNRLTWKNTTNGSILETILNSYLSLRELSLGSNQLKGGVLPTRIQQLTGLEILDLSYSNLEGIISVEVFNNTFLPALKHLDLSNNRIQGQVTNSFAQMPALTYLNLANNNLSGSLPPLPANLFNASWYSGNPGLCGAPLPSCPEPQVPSPKSGIQLWLVLTIVTVCLLLSGSSCTLLGWRWKVEAAKHKQDEELIAALLDRDTTTLMPLRELKKVTDNFSDSFQVGVGGFGTVYAGTLDNGTKVAIKRSRRVGTAEDKCQFLNEVKILSKVHHRNLVRLLGCCLCNKVALLVFEFVPNGTLEEHLRRKGGRPPLNWSQRLLIAAQTADALNYLHSSANPPIYHLDVKSANILLDEKLHAKVADFGISKLLPDVDATHVTAIGLQGTIGYMDPESVVSSHLSGKSDVYAFGVVLLELISAKSVVDRTRGDGPEVSLLGWATPLIEAGRLDEVIDPALSNTFQAVEGKDSIEAVARLAIRCSAFSSRSRPNMQEIWHALRSMWLSRTDNCTASATTSDTGCEDDTNRLLAEFTDSSSTTGRTSGVALSTFGR